MSKTVEKFFFILSWLFQGSSYLSPTAYGVLHRKHHEHADTEQDVHSPKYDKSLWKMMWKTKIIYSDIFYGRTEVEPKYKKNLPVWRSFDIFADSWPSRIFWGLAYIAFYVIFADHWWLYLLLPIQLLSGPVHGAVINWFAHKYGYRNFEVSDTSRNFLPVDFLMLGESYHNNHHKHGSNPNFGHRWFEIDPIYYVIKGFNAIGLIKLRKA